MSKNKPRYFSDLTLEEMFECHDHTYMMSDDFRYYESGRREQQIIEDKVKESLKKEEVPKSDDSVVISKPGTYVVEEEKPKKKTEDLYGEQSTGDPISEPKPFVPKNQANPGGFGAVTPNKK